MNIIIIFVRKNFFQLNLYIIYLLFIYLLGFFIQIDFSFLIFDFLKQKVLGNLIPEKEGKKKGKNKSIKAKKEGKNASNLRDSILNCEK